MTGGRVNGDRAAKFHGLLSSSMTFVQKVNDLVSTIPGMSDLVSSAHTSFDPLE